MEELANALADKSLGNLPPDKDLVDAFKSLTTYYLGTEKLDKGDERDATSGMAGVRERLKAV